MGGVNWDVYDKYLEYLYSAVSCIAIFLDFVVLTRTHAPQGLGVRGNEDLDL